MMEKSKEYLESSLNFRISSKLELQIKEIN
jgi:hypothetical protein